MSPSALVVLDWLGTFAWHSSLALAVALAATWLLRGRAVGLQERLLRFAMWAGLASSLVQFGLLGGPWRATPRVDAAAAAATHLELPAITMLASTPLPEPTAAPVDWSPWLGALCAIAALVGLGAWATARTRLARVLATRRPETDPRVLGTAAAVASELGLRRVPRLTRCERLATPIVFGVLRGEAVLPARVAELDDASLRALLAHEFAHLRRRDPAVLAGVTLLQAVCPWQLLLPLVRRRWLHLVELRCDAIAVARSSPTAVARCLIEVAGWLQSAPRAPRLALGMAARPSSLRDRVDAALQRREGAPPRRAWSLAFGGLSLSTLSLAAPGLEPRRAVAEPAPEFLLSLAETPSATSTVDLLVEVLHEREALAAELEQLRAEFVGRPEAPELVQLLAAIDDRMQIVERLALRVQRRIATDGEGR
ncbi:MAG: M56 family metallopeptidase [Planctomycetes bacterium]|nr:M56 family metallopeptidase [Planctomycetota bacterium]